MLLFDAASLSLYKICFLHLLVRRRHRNYIWKCNSLSTEQPEQYNHNINVYYTRKSRAIQHNRLKIFLFSFFLLFVVIILVCCRKLTLYFICFQLALCILLFFVFVFLFLFCFLICFSTNVNVFVLKSMFFFFWIAFRAFFFSKCIFV